MRLSLRPDAVFPAYESLSAEDLRARGVRLLLTDLDFTLAPKSQKEPDEGLRNWIDSLLKGGIQVMIISNNRSSERVERFCSTLGISYEGRAGKPSPKGLEHAMARAGASKGETAMLGDKLLTDMLAANLTGVRALMVEPRGGARGPWQKVLHTLQRPFKALSRRNWG